MSMVINVGRPTAAPTAAAALTPAAGPDRALWMGRPRAVSNVMSPPAECVIMRRTSG